MLKLCVTAIATILRGFRSPGEQAVACSGCLNYVLGSGLTFGEAGKRNKFEHEFDVSISSCPHCFLCCAGGEIFHAAVRSRSTLDFICHGQITFVLLHFAKAGKHLWAFVLILRTVCLRMKWNYYISHFNIGNSRSVLSIATSLGFQ